ncbi:MAG TPA: hypothetical protein VMW27_01335 [Thermoanaerobaculia bacterium]|nr:hypothetical protein [Thermoanaerobaculia bacterium]
MSHRRIWPHDSDRRVTVRATGEQMISWAATGRQYGNRSVAEFLAFAGDFTVKQLDEWQEKALRAEARREKKRLKEKEQKP